MLDVLSNNPPPLRGQPDELRDLLADPANASVSNREIGRRIGLDHRYIAGYRAALAHRGEGPAPHAAMLADGAGTTPATFPGRWQHTPNMPGLTVAFEPPAFYSYRLPGAGGTGRAHKIRRRRRPRAFARSRAA